MSRKYTYFFIVVALLAILSACNNSSLQVIKETAGAEQVPRPQITLPGTVDELIKILQGPDTEAKIMAAVRLGSMGKMAELAIKPLTRNLYDENPEVRRRSAEALGKIGLNQKLHCHI
jgi:HEAT repeat protein